MYSQDVVSPPPALEANVHPQGSSPLDVSLPADVSLGSLDPAPLSPTQNMAQPSTPADGPTPSGRRRDRVAQSRRFFSMAMGKGHLCMFVGADPGGDPELFGCIMCRKSYRNSDYGTSSASKHFKGDHHYALDMCYRRALDLPLYSQRQTPDVVTSAEDIVRIDGLIRAAGAVVSPEVVALIEKRLTDGYAVLDGQRYSLMDNCKRFSLRSRSEIEILVAVRLLRSSVLCANVNEVVSLFRDIMPYSPNARWSDLSSCWYQHMIHHVFSFQLWDEFLRMAAPLDYFSFTVKRYIAFFLFFFQSWVSPEFPVFPNLGKSGMF